jgi:hypothetical protein
MHPQTLTVNCTQAHMVNCTQTHMVNSTTAHRTAALPCCAGNSPQLPSRMWCVTLLQVHAGLRSPDRMAAGTGRAQCGRIGHTKSVTRPDNILHLPVRRYFNRCTRQLGTCKRCHIVGEHCSTIPTSSRRIEARLTGRGQRRYASVLHSQVHTSRHGWIKQYNSSRPLLQRQQNCCVETTKLGSSWKMTALRTPHDEAGCVCRT